MKLILTMIIIILIVVMLTFILRYVMRKRGVDNQNLFVIVAVQLIGTCAGFLLAFYATDYQEKEQDKDLLKGYLESSLASIEDSIVTVNDRINNAQFVMKRYPDANPKDITYYKNIFHNEILSEIMKNANAYSLLSKEAKRVIPIMIFNNQSNLADYTPDTNDYYNYLTLEQMKANLIWQKKMVMLELAFQKNEIDKKEVKEKYTKIGKEYDKRWAAINKEWGHTLEEAMKQKEDKKGKE